LHCNAVAEQEPENEEDNQKKQQIFGRIKLHYSGKNILINKFYKGRIIKHPV
jgi:hypothetical protein